MSNPYFLDWKNNGILEWGRAIKFRWGPVYVVLKKGMGWFFLLTGSSDPNLHHILFCHHTFTIEGHYTTEHMQFLYIANLYLAVMFANEWEVVGNHYSKSIFSSYNVSWSATEVVSDHYSKSIFSCYNVNDSSGG